MKGKCEKEIIKRRKEKKNKRSRRTVNISTAGVGQN